MIFQPRDSRHPVGVRTVNMRSVITFLTSLLLLGSLHAASPHDYLKHPDAWYKSPQASEYARNILTWQCADGDWPKNIDTISAPRPATNTASGTFDNSATTGELRFLAKVQAAQPAPAILAAFNKGLDLILAAQYPNGGWPQSYPPPAGYGRHITFNDDTFLRLAQFARDVAELPSFNFVPQQTREKAKTAFAKSIECILATQIKVNGKLTVWCAQHDEITLEPRPARTYELVSLSGAESAKILLFLMTLPNPDERIRNSVSAGVAWVEQVKISGFRLDRTGGERKLIKDPSAPLIWARFYEIETNRPIFSGRDGVKRYNFEEIEAERRNGYSWYGNGGEAVLKQYREWTISPPKQAPFKL